MPLIIDKYSSSILNNISFTLKAGKNLIVLGSNGVGKTTLAKVLCGITPSSSVSIEGINPSKMYGEKRTRLINYIPTKLDIFDAFITVHEFLKLSYFNNTISIKKSIERTLEKLHILHLANKSCHTLSSGESQ